MNTLVANALTQAVLAGTEASFWFPPQASTTAADIDWIYYFVYWISVFFTVIIFGAAIWFAIKFRSKKTAGARPPTPSEVETCTPRGSKSGSYSVERVTAELVPEPPMYTSGFPLRFWS